MSIMTTLFWLLPVFSVFKPSPCVLVPASYPDVVHLQQMILKYFIPLTPTRLFQFYIYSHVYSFVATLHTLIRSVHHT